MPPKRKRTTANTARQPRKRRLTTKAPVIKSKNKARLEPPQKWHNPHVRELESITEKIAQMEAELQEPPPGLDVENAKYRLGLYCKETVVVEEKAVAWKDPLATRIQYLQQAQSEAYTHPKHLANIRTVLKHYISEDEDWTAPSRNITFLLMDGNIMAIIPFNRTWYPTEKEVKRYGVVTDADALERFKHALDNNPGLVWFERPLWAPPMQIFAIMELKRLGMNSTIKNWSGGRWDSPLDENGENAITMDFLLDSGAEVCMGFEDDIGHLDPDKAIVPETAEAITPLGEKFKVNRYFLDMRILNQDGTPLSVWFRECYGMLGKSAPSGAVRPSLLMADGATVLKKMLRAKTPEDEEDTSSDDDDEDDDENDENEDKDKDKDKDKDEDEDEGDKEEGEEEEEISTSGGSKTLRRSKRQAAKAAASKIARKLRRAVRKAKKGV